MSLSRSPSPLSGGGWAAPGLGNGPSTFSGRSSPNKGYNGLGSGSSNTVTWASAKAKGNDANGYSTYKYGFFRKHMRRLSSSLPRFTLGGREYADKEKLGRGRWQSNSSNNIGRLRMHLGRMLRRSRWRFLLVLGFILMVMFTASCEFSFITSECRSF
jgi:mannan polymerase II complex MNN10 subunit